MLDAYNTHTVSGETVTGIVNRTLVGLLSEADADEIDTLKGLLGKELANVRGEKVDG
jgi:hypothetical protein